MEDLHKKIVDEILPRLAEKLKQEGIILGHDKKQIEIEDLLGIRINPDRILHLSNGKNILVEVVNPEKPKRFIGDRSIDTLQENYSSYVFCSISTRTGDT